MDLDVTSSTLYYLPFQNNNFSAISLSLIGIEEGGLYDVNLDGNYLVLTPWDGDTPPVDSRTPSGGLYFNNDYLYLGTIYAIQDDVVKWQTHPTPSSYGCNNELGLFNAYNRLPVIAINEDLNTEWQYNSSGLRFADNSNLFRINWIDGLGDVFCEGEYQVSVAGLSSSAAAATVGVGLDQGEYPLCWNGGFQQAALNGTALGMPVSGKFWTNGSIGRHFWQAIEQSTNVAIGFFGNDFACLIARLSI